MQLKSISTLLLPGLLTLVSTLAAAPVTYTYTPIAEPNGAGGSRTLVAGLNNAGQVVGSYFDNSSRQTTGFLYANGTYTSITAPGATSTQPLGINNLGQIVGVYQDNTNASHLFLDTNGAFTTINPTNGVLQSASGGIFQAGINDLGQIVSTTSVSGNIVGFLYSQGQFTSIPVLTGTSTTAYSAVGINNKGQIAVLRVDSTGVEGTSLYFNGTLTALPTYGNTTGINNAGDIVGHYPDDVQIPGSYLYSNGTVTGFPYTTYPDLLNIQGINDAGQLISNGLNGAVLATPNTAATPEPSSLLLLGNGLSGLAYFVRSKRKQAAKASV